MIQIKFKDTDPDTGNISQEMTIATCEKTEHAKWIIEALYKHSEEPNRDFYREVIGETLPIVKEEIKSSEKKKIKLTEAEAKEKVNEIDEEIRRRAEAESQMKARMIDDEIRKQSVLKRKTEHEERLKAKAEADKQNKRPPNNGYVPYDQFKF
jgi:hypothetical protein